NHTPQKEEVEKTPKKEVFYKKEASQGKTSKKEPKVDKLSDRSFPKGKTKKDLNENTGNTSKKESKKSKTRSKKDESVQSKTDKPYKKDESKQKFTKKEYRPSAIYLNGKAIHYKTGSGGRNINVGDRASAVTAGNA